MTNSLYSAAGSLKSARAEIIAHIQQFKINTSNYEEVAELLGYVSRIASLQANLESIANRYGEPENGNLRDASAAARKTARAAS